MISVREAPLPPTYVALGFLYVAHNSSTSLLESYTYRSIKTTKLVTSETTHREVYRILIFVDGIPRKIGAEA